MNFNWSPPHLWARGDGSREEGLVMLLDINPTLSLKLSIIVKCRGNASAVGMISEKTNKATTTGSSSSILIV